VLSVVHEPQVTMAQGFFFFAWRRRKGSFQKGRQLPA